MAGNNASDTFGFYQLYGPEIWRHSLTMEQECKYKKIAEKRRKMRNKLRIATISMILVWVFFYNLLVKEQPFWTALFQVLDTISDDFIMGAMFAIGVGFGIVAVFSFTKLYTQIIANVHSFRMIEDLFYKNLVRGYWKSFFFSILTLEDQPLPDTVCPKRVSSLVLSFSFIYIMSWIYVILFSEALFFVSWSAGVDLPINSDTLYYLPMLGLAIPFSARVMAYLRYPYAQDYADFIPAAIFVLLLVFSLGELHDSHDQKFFLPQVFASTSFKLNFLRNGAFLAFIPVFFEGAFWLFELSRVEGVETKSDT
jgi:hypothetical protein